MVIFLNRLFVTSSGFSTNLLREKSKEILIKLGAKVTSSVTILSDYLIYGDNPGSKFEKASELGGQFNVAKKIPGKTEFDETIRYFNDRLNTLGVDIQLNSEVNIDIIILIFMIL